jgi:nitroreductase
VLLLAVAKTVGDDGKVNRYAKHDVGMANQNLLLQAIALGLHCRPMAGFDRKRVRQSFHIPEGFEPLVMIAVGYPGRIEDLTEEVQKRQAQPRERRSIEDFTFYGDWGISYSPGF